LGLYKSSYGFFVVHPKTSGKSTFDTRDRSAAISRWVEKIFEASTSWVSCVMVGPQRLRLIVITHRTVDSLKHQAMQNLLYLTQTR
jgi:hypothetical protein